MKKSIIAGMTALLLIFVASRISFTERSEEQTTGHVEKVASNQEDLIREQSIEVKTEENSSEGVSPVIKIITGREASDLHWVERNELLLQLKSKHLSVGDILALREFLDEQPGKEGGNLAFHSLKNDTLQLLIEDGRFSTELGEKMINYLLEDDEHQVWREYVAQFIPQFFGKNLSVHQRLLPEGEKLSKDLLDSLWYVSDETEGSVAGTSILSLIDLSKKGYVEEDKVMQKAESVALNNSMTSSSRMGAVFILGKYGNSHQAQNLINLVFDNSSSITLRMSAIQSAGKLSNGDEEFIQRLEENFINNEIADKRLKSASLAVIRENQKKQGS